MKISHHWLCRPVSAAIIICLAVPCGEAATVRQQTEDVHAAQAQTANSVSASGTSTADAGQSKTLPDDSSSAGSQTGSKLQSRNLPPTQNQQQSSPTQPVGTAAAPYEKTQGIAGSRPAGAVLAPAKQRRTRSFLIRVGLIVGAAVAVGTVVALSKGSPSHP